jgi:hypothetical protein
MHRHAPLLYSVYWLLHVSAVAYHHQGASWIRLCYIKYNRIGGISYNVWLRGLCAGVSWFLLLCFPAGNHDTPSHRLLNQHYVIYHQIDLYFHVTQTDPEAP